MEDSVKYVIGIDQGASKTHAIVSDEYGIVLGMGKSYGACHSSDGMTHAITAVKEAVDQASRAKRNFHSGDRANSGGYDWS